MKPVRMVEALAAELHAAFEEAVPGFQKSPPGVLWGLLHSIGRHRWLTVAEAALGHPYAEAGVVEERDEAREALESAAKSLRSCARMAMDANEDDVGLAGYATSRAAVAERALKSKVTP